MQNGTRLFPIVGIGASAGGLEAFTALLRSLPDNLNMGYVILQHLAPESESVLPNLLARSTTMPVQEARDGSVVEPNHVYVMPPHVQMTIEQGVLKLQPLPETRGRYQTIDTFLRSLAISQQDQAIGILLSGAGSDGSHGLQDIKVHGGVTFAQDRASASYYDMPGNAIAKGCVDFIQSPQEIVRELIRISQHPPIDLIQTEGSTKAVAITLPDKPPLQQIFQLLLQGTGVDFTMYKLTMIERRLLHRMSTQHIDSLDEYLVYLKHNEKEAELLFQDLLIGVTEFFRDPLAFQALTQVVFPAILKKKASGEPIRIWVPGCSTGEEVYSIAICLQEFLTESTLTPPIRIFGTDINPRAIEQARRGSYSPEAMENVSPERLQRFFHLTGRNYQIHQSIREFCVFAQQNICQDPPFTQLDLLSCRNLLIFLTPEVQQRALQTFSFALRPQGVLLLGVAETADSASDLFECIDRRQKLYVRKAVSMKPQFKVAARPPEKAIQVPDKAKERIPTYAVDGGSIQKEADRLLLARYVPASVVINENMEILYFRGRTSSYLEPVTGKASFQLLKMVREGLALALRTAVAQTKKMGLPVKEEAIRIYDQGKERLITIEVIPLLQTPSSERHFLVLFEDIPVPVPSPSQISSLSEEEMHLEAEKAKDHWIRQLELELTTSREETLSVIEQLEATNEEMQAANEELLSSNEEFQSVNEELTTTKEEIQASNEELLTLNQELQSSNQELQTARDFNDGIVETIHDPLLILDTTLHIKRANKAFYQFFQMAPEVTEQQYLFEIGNGQWNVPELRHLLEDVLVQKHILQNFEMNYHVPAIGNKILLLYARCIARANNDEPSLLLTCEDITERKEIERQKDIFLGIASHELKTPVTSIKLYTQMLQKRFQKAGDVASAAVVAKMDTQLSSLTHLMTELLDATKLQVGALPIQIMQFDVNDLVRGVVEDMQQTTDQHQIKIEGNVREPFSADRERISQILVNLLSNAIKYSPEAKPIVVRLTADTGHVTLSVQDFGIGIAANQQAHLFERFFRVRDPAHETYPGLGLGLYISAEIAKQHGGRMWVESQEGAGSTFFVSLPLRPQLATS